MVGQDVAVHGKAIGERDLPKIALPPGGNGAEESEPQQAVVHSRRNDNGRAPASLFVSRRGIEVEPHEVAALGDEGLRPSPSVPTEQPAVLGVGADPVPDQHVAVPYSKDAVPYPNPSRVDVVVSRGALEVQALVIGIVPELLVRTVRLTPRVDRQRREESPKLTSPSRAQSLLRLGVL